MATRKRRRRKPAAERNTGARPDETIARSTGWEERALARVRKHVSELADGTGAQESGWEADTLTRLERYFDRNKD